MIKYKCVSCGTGLETEDSLSGKKEPCPTCGCINIIPLSKGDLAEQQRQEAERRQMIKEREAKNKEREREVNLQQKEAEKRQRMERWLADNPQDQKEKGLSENRHRAEKLESGFTKATKIEEALGILGVLYMIAGVLGFFGGFFVAGPSLPGLLCGLGLLGSCFVAGISCFAAQCGLHYLRRIMNAVEAWE